MKTHTHTHTPGPWKSVEARVYQNFTVCGQPSSRLVCSCSTHSDYTPSAEQNANAQLIAAAPELLAALTRAEACLMDIARGAILTGENLRIWAETVLVLLPLEAEKARAAISKAEGRT